MTMLYTLTIQPQSLFEHLHISVWHLRCRRNVFNKRFVVYLITLLNCDRKCVIRLIITQNTILQLLT